MEYFNPWRKVLRSTHRCHLRRSLVCLQHSFRCPSFLVILAFSLNDCREIVTGLCLWWHCSFYYSQNPTVTFHCMKRYCPEDKLYSLEETIKWILCVLYVLFVLALRSDMLCFKYGLCYFSTCSVLSCNNPGDTYQNIIFSRHWVIWFICIMLLNAPESQKDILATNGSQAGCQQPYGCVLCGSCSIQSQAFWLQKNQVD